MKLHNSGAAFKLLHLQWEPMGLELTATDRVGKSDGNERYANTFVDSNRNKE